MSQRGKVSKPEGYLSVQQVVVQVQACQAHKESRPIPVVKTKQRAGWIPQAFKALQVGLWRQFGRNVHVWQDENEGQRREGGEVAQVVGIPPGQSVSWRCNCSRVVLRHLNWDGIAPRNWFLFSNSHSSREMLLQCFGRNLSTQLIPVAGPALPSRPDRPTVEGIRLLSCFEVRVCRFKVASKPQFGGMALRASLVSVEAEQQSTLSSSPHHDRRPALR